MQPFQYAISLQPWQFFVTLTFASRNERNQPVTVPNLVGRRKMLFAFLRETAQGLKRDRERRLIDGVPFSALHWVAREECGERGGRYHFHLLISGLPLGRVNRTETFAHKAIWQRIGGGFVDSRKFDASLSGAAYVLKGLDEWSLSRANAYEMGKFRETVDREVIVADALLKKWVRDSGKLRPSEGSLKPDNSAVTLSAPSNGASRLARKRNASITDRLRYEVFDLHPAGVSFVR